MSLARSTTTEPDTFNAADFLVDRHVRDGNGARPAVVTDTRTLSYSQLSHEIQTVAAGLRDIGVRPEERVLMCMVDDVELFTAILATMRLGAIAVPASTMLTGTELAKLVVDSRARVMLASPEYSDAVVEAVESSAELRHVVFAGKSSAAVRPSVHVHSWETFVGDAASYQQPHRTCGDSPALWLYTSGTTGMPKAAMHRHIDIKFVAENYGQRVLGIRPGDRCLSVAKLFFAYGIGNSMFFPLSVGATALLEPQRPTPKLMAGRARGDRATLLFGTPSFWGPLLASDVPDDAFTSVRQAVSAGEALPARMFHGVLDRFGVEILDGIGSTEMLHIFVSNRPGQVRPSSSGTPVPGYDIEIRDEQDVPITDDGLPGELVVRGESAATGYWCRVAASRQVFIGEWTRTGDTYVRNSDGTYSCLGRFNDMLKVGGIWVTPSEVEDRLLEHPDVAEVAVVGAQDADGLDKPAACVVPVPGHHIDADDLIQWCRQELAAFKRPRVVVEWDELPKTATGKIRRNVLRETLRLRLRGDTSAAAPSSSADVQGPMLETS